MPKSDYFLCSQRIGFRSWSPSDLELAIGLWGDREVTRLFESEPTSRSRIKQRLESEIEQAARDGMQYWPIFELASGEHIGCCGLRPYSPMENVCELGFHLRPQFWGRGLATEAARTVIVYGFERLCTGAIFAGHHPDNTASRKVLLKLGFQPIESQLYEPTGLLHPSYMLYPEPHGPA